MFTVELDARDAQQLLNVMNTRMGHIQNRIDASAPAIAETGASLIRAEIASIPGIGPFMAARTGIVPQYLPGVVALTVYGMNEAEAGYPAVTGGAVKGSMNLWEKHEYGTFMTASSETQEFYKDADGVRATREGRTEGAGSPYQGEVRRTIRNMVMQLHGALRAVVATAGYSVMGDIVEEASMGRIKVGSGIREIMEKVGVTMGDLAMANVSSIGIKPGGQIYVNAHNGKGYTWKSPSSVRMPTSANYA